MMGVTEKERPGNRTRFIATVRRSPQCSQPSKYTPHSGCVAPVLCGAEVGGGDGPCRCFVGLLCDRSRCCSRWRCRAATATGASSPLSAARPQFPLQNATSAAPRQKWDLPPGAPSGDPGGRRRAWPARGRALQPAPRRLEEEAAGVRAGTGHGGGEKMPHRRSLCWGDNAGWHLSAHQNDCRGAGNGRPTPKRKPCASVGHVGQEVQRGQQRDLHGGHVLWGVLVPSFVAPGHQRRSARS